MWDPGLSPGAEKNSGKTWKTQNRSVDVFVVLYQY